MRPILILGLIALYPSAAPAQAVSAPTPAPTPAPATANVGPARGGDITRDEYIQRAVERARRAAEQRFDRMDVNHDGVVTADERRAVRAQRHGLQSQSQSQ